MTKYVESIVRTDKLWCSDCRNKINKGDNVIFELTENLNMKSVFCYECGAKYELRVVDDQRHPFDLDN